MNGPLLHSPASESEAPGLTLPLRFGGNADEVIRHAHLSYREAQPGCTAARVAAKTSILRHYDVPGMQQVVAICFWGRSGSLLLSSYLDGHDDLLVPPMIVTSLIYPFFRDYESLSIWEKLVAYPAYFDGKYFDHKFFTGEFPIDVAEYYGAVHALHARYRSESAEWLEARLRFFQFLNIAIAVAIGRMVRNPRPVIVYAQHFFDDRAAKSLVEDFPCGRFIHTIRDPISAFDSWYDRYFYLNTHGNIGRRDPWYMSTAFDTMSTLLPLDRPQHGMEMRTRAVRFEDLHLAPEETMRRVSSWLGVPYRPSMAESTFNGGPYVVESNGVAWTGANPANARRRSKNLNFADRLLIFALLQADFEEWGYPIPRIFRHRWIRACTIAMLWLVPMKMDLRTARAVLVLQVLPAFRRRQFAYALRALRFLLASRVRLMLVVVREARTQLRGERARLKIL